MIRESRPNRTACLAALALLLMTLDTRAGLFFKEKETPKPGKPRYIEHSHERAGNPLEISRLAHPSFTPKYTGGYVGGGLAFGGHARRAEEGTWGWDYTGPIGLRRVFQGWSHGRHYQGGMGTYRTDGPAVPDPIGRVSSMIRR